MESTDLSEEEENHYLKWYLQEQYVFPRCLKPAILLNSKKNKLKHPDFPHDDLLMKKLGQISVCMSETNRQIRAVLFYVV